MTGRLKELIPQEAAGGIYLAVAAVAALILANTPLNVFYQGFLEIPVVVRLGEFEIAKPLILWVNDGLMALFFLMVGLEIKRELIEGHLSSFDQVVLPGIAAVAGIVFPALIYYLFTSDDPVAVNGWAIPSATDIAFALGVFTIFGTRLPITLKLFLLTVAIFDDIGAIVIIALFYSQDLSTTSLAVAVAGLIGLFILNRRGVSSIAPYMLVGVVVWAAVLKSGVHATLAGFVVAWFIPLKIKNPHGKALLPSLENALHPWVAFLILPVFAFSNAGVNMVGAGIEQLFNPVTLGIALGLFLGKQIGIFGMCWLAVKTKLAKLPEGATWPQLYAVSLLCGIGFTMSLFIGTLAFEDQGLSYQISVKIGVLLGSLISAVTAIVVILNSTKEKENTDVPKSESS